MNDIKKLKKKIRLFFDGPNFDQLNEKFLVKIDGYTFNPSLFKKNGAKNYINHCKKILKYTKNKPVSFEVFGDSYEEMIKQANFLSSLSKNIYVKIPITYTNGQSTLKVIKNLVDHNINLNITAIFTRKQVKKILPTLKDTNSIISIFAGRIYDSGVDAFIEMREMNNLIKGSSSCKSLWASSRMVYDFIHAINCNTDIITMSHDHITKMKNFKLSLKKFSLNTVKQFHQDAATSGYRI